MKKIILLAALFVVSFSAQAQIPDGSTAPDFTATDLNGVEWNLYDILDQGKSVILDVSATWCGPCWSYHQGGNLETIWTDYGPDGTDEMFVFMIEGDAATTIDDLYGTGSNTLGDWTVGIEYPIIDAAEIANAYQIAYYPTLFLVCPDKTVTEIGQQSVAGLYAGHGQCPSWISGVNNVAAGSYSGTGNVTCGQDAVITPKLTIQNLGSDNLISCTVEMSVDGVSTETVEWTGDLATIETAEVTFADLNVSSSAELSFAVTIPNGVADDSEGNNVLVEVLGSDRAGVEVTFEITTDFWPEEITWELKDDTGAVLFSNADEGALTCDNTYTQVYTLEDGKCYTMSVGDSFGDGILNGAINPGSHSCGTANGMESIAMGAISISSDQGLLHDAIDYGSGVDIEFLVAAPLAVQELSLEGLNVYPNPASDNVNLSFGLNEASKLNVTVYNMLGQAVKTVGAQTYGAGNHTVEINTAGVTNGMYFVNISDGTAVVTRKLTIAK